MCRRWRRSRWLFDQSLASVGGAAVVLGYPGLASFAATPARISEIIQLNAPDIYGTTMLIREVYVLASTHEYGDSGGPLIDLDGNVLGVYFGSKVGDPNTGFALTASQVAAQMAKVANTVPVGTGACLPHPT